MGTRRQVTEGEIIFDQGESRRAFFVVIRGRIQIVSPTRQGEVPITVHEGGEFTGEVDMLAGRRSLVRARALLTYRALGRSADAVAAISKALKLDPDLPEVHNNVGIIWFAEGEQARAESAFREAIRIRPDYADAHGNLAGLLSAASRFAEARDEFEISLRLRPADAATRYNYAMMLGRTSHFDEAQSELETSLRADPRFADAHLLLGDLLMARHRTQDAASHYREVLRIIPESRPESRPESSRAHLGLGAALMAGGDLEGAVSHLKRAAAAKDAAVREQAAEMLRQIEKQR